MRRPFSLTVPLLLLLLTGCGSPPAAEPPPAPSAAPEASADLAPRTGPEANSATEASSATEANAPPAAAASDAATLARDLVKSGGRRIGYSSTKKAFAHPVERRISGGFSLDIQFTGDDGSPRDTLRVCQPGECEDRLDELLKAFLPTLTERLERDGFTTLRAIGWQGGSNELEVSTLSAKLHFDKGRLTKVVAGKPAAALAQLGGSRLATTPEAVFVVPGGKLLALFAKPSGDGKGLVQELHLFKIP